MLKQRLQRSVRATVVGMAVNGLLAVVKFCAGVFGHSQALIADAVESLADIFSSVIVWRGLVVAAEPEDEDHPYGHGKAEPIAAAIVSSILLAAAVWIVIQSAREIRQYPHFGPEPYTLVVLILVVLVKEALFRFVHGVSAEVESSAVRTDAWHHRSDALTSLAAGVGISVALIGGPRYAVADDYAAIAAAGVIAWNGWRLLVSALGELMDRAPAKDIVQRVREIAQQTKGVERVEKCFLRKMGYHFYADMHVEVNPQMTVLQGHEIAHDVKDRIRTELPRIRDVLVHVEPHRGAPAG